MLLATVIHAVLHDSHVYTYHTGVHTQKTQPACKPW